MQEFIAIADQCIARESMVTGSKVLSLISIKILNYGVISGAVIRW